MTQFFILYFVNVKFGFSKRFFIIQVFAKISFFIL